jgi:predicted acetyltransferase
MKVPVENLQYGTIKLLFIKIVETDSSRGLVPVYHFKILNLNDEVVGHINFKNGDTEHVLQYAGHIGYEIRDGYRGNGYAYFACLALKQFLRKDYAEVILTSDPDNLASIRTIKKLGARFINEVVVAQTDPSYENGSRVKHRFIWEL